MRYREIRAYIDYYTGRAKYLFVHIPKNAGVSIRKSVELQGRLVGAEPRFHRSRAYTRELLRVMRENGEHHGYHHARLVDIHPSVRHRLQPVAVIRNPWSRVVSRFRFALLTMDQGNAPPDYAPRTFDRFLEERHLYGDKEYYWHRAVRGWYPQVDYVEDEEGQLGAHLLRQENLGEESTRYFGLSEAPPRRNVTGGKAKPYQAYYTPKTIQVVADWYARDVNTFGFDFDSAATRNVHFADIPPLRLRRAA
ncbi:MAG: sulfotransferase family 2 domain-containing protein [Pirellulales bacterium]|nr:sulfotransferase family 2 domain-containing protein [Pirellulales bacterium]